MAQTTTSAITPERFATAILDLPFSNLYTKAAELRNSISHLKSSNEQMLPFADEGDQDCKEAMFENLAVIGRMNERIGLLKAEVERRGGLWSEHAAAGLSLEEGEGIVVDGGSERAVNGVPAAPNGEVREDGGQREQQRPSGRLTDEELRRRLEAQMAGDDDQDNEDGVHL